MQRKISILGCGWLGKAVARRLLEAGYIVSGSATSDESLNHLGDCGVRPFKIELTPTSVSGDKRFFDCDVLLISVPPGRKSGDGDQYPGKIRSVMEALQPGANPQIIFISSTSVYPDADRLMQEDDYDPSSVLGKAEDALSAGGAFQPIVLRMAGLAGPGRHPGRFLSGKEVCGGENPVNMVHLTDCVAVISLIIKSGTRNRTYNVCAPVHPTKRTFYTHMAELAGLALPRFVEPDRPGGKVIDSSRLISELKFDFTFPDPMAFLF